MDDKALQKLQRLIAALPASGARAEASERPGETILHWRDGGITVETRLLALAARQGLVTRRGSRIAATAEAASFLRRQRKTGPENHAAQHQTVEFERRTVDGIDQTVCINATESPLAALARLKSREGAPYLPREAVAAGERLAADFTRGQMQPRITMSFEPRLNVANKGMRGSAAELSDSAMSARRRIAGAIGAMGPELAGVALDVCCFMKGLETVERERQWPARSAKLMLKTALMTLHRHYQPPAKSGTRQWGGEGYRPEIQGR